MNALYKVDEKKYNDGFDRLVLHDFSGKVTKSVGLTIEVDLPSATVGGICELNVGANAPRVSCEVIGFKNDKTVLMPLDSMKGISTQSTVKFISKEATTVVSDSLLGRVLDGAGKPVDGKGEIPDAIERSIYVSSRNPLDRISISDPLDLGVRSINGFMTCGRGQKMGIIAGSGVGKSVLLGMIARNTNADVNVIALVGERGREVREYIENDLGPEGLSRSVLVVATSDQSPLLRMRASYIAATIAEHFAGQGKHVLFLMDSLTRFCIAQREIGLSLGELPVTKGYTPSVFSALPKLLERAGTQRDGKGSITGLYTVLVDGDDMDDPIGDAARSFTDGHIVLSRKLADRGHYPPIDVVSSISRVMRGITSQEHYDSSVALRELMAIYSDSEDLIQIGAYVKGINSKLDQAISVNNTINGLLRQQVGESTSIDETKALMKSILGESQ